MAGLWSEGENPENYGFLGAYKALDLMRFYIVTNAKTYSNSLRYQWTYIQKRADENKELLCKKNYYKKFRWVLTANFAHPEQLKLPVLCRIRAMMSHFKFYKCLHKVKMILLKRENK